MSSVWIYLDCMCLSLPIFVFSQSSGMNRLVIEMEVIGQRKVKGMTYERKGHISSKKHLFSVR